MTAAEIELHNLLVTAGIICLAILAWMARYRRPECPDCEHCKVRHKQEVTQQREAEHDMAHRSWGKCGDKDCERNNRR